MARAIAGATVSFGLVSIPVKLFAATQASAGVSFNLLHKKCNTRLKQQYVCPTDNEIVHRDDMVKGYEFAKDQYVTFTPDELKSLEEKATGSIDIAEFVPLAAIDPVYFDRPYYLGPEKGGDKAYLLLAEAMRETGRAALARYAARGKQYLVMLRAMEDGLVMQQLRYAEEVRPFSEIGVPDVQVKPEELNLALQLMEQNMKKEFHPEHYKDTVRNRMLEVIQQKVEGQEITVGAAEAPKAQIIDLMDALKASLGVEGEAKKAKPAKPAEDRKPAKRSPRAPAKAEAPAKKRTAR
jgi:DNA end-binding protein Ku